MKNEKTIHPDNQYIREVVKGIKNKNYKNLVFQELESHLHDRIDYYKELGYDEETAIEKATEDMGNPEETAIPLNTLHSQKWYKQPATVIVLLLLVVQFFLLLFFSDFRYLRGVIGPVVQPIYMQVFHIFPDGICDYIIRDIASILILYFNVFVIFFGWKKQNKIIMIAETISVSLQFIFAPYQPEFYGITRLILNGYYSYLYGMYENNTELDAGAYDVWYQIITLLILLIMLLMLCCCIVFAVGIMKKERGQLNSSEVRKHKIYRRILMGITTAHFVVVSVSMVVAGVYINTKIEKETGMRKEIIDCLLDKDKTQKELTEDLQQLTKEIYPGKVVIEDVQNSSDEERLTSEISTDNIRVMIEQNDGEEKNDLWQCCDIEYKLPYFYTAGLFAEEPLLHENLNCTEIEFDIIYEGMTLQEFAETNLIYKAIEYNSERFNYNYDVFVLRKEDGTLKSLHFFNEKYVEYNGNCEDSEFENLLRSAEK